MPPTPAVPIFLICLHILAAAPAALLDLPWLLRLAWLAAIGVLLATSLRRERIRRIRLTEDGGWRLFGAAEPMEAELCGWFAQTWLTVLHFRAGARRHTVVLLPVDPAHAQAQRRLRALLRLGAGWDAAES